MQEMEKYEVLKKQEESRRPGKAVLLRSITQLCLTLCDPMDWGPPGFSVPEIFQAITLEWVVRPSSRESSHVFIQFSSVQFSCSVCPTLCDPMNHSTPGLPVHHQLSEFTQTHVHRVSDAIQPSHPGSSPSPPARNPFQHQSLFQ